MMKKLISEKTIIEMFNSGNLKIEVTPDIIITPQAESKAAQLGIEIIKGTSQKISYTDKQRIIDAVIERFPGGNYSRAKIEKVVQEVINSLS